MSDNRADAASRKMAAVQSVLDDLEKKYPDTSDEHLNTVLDILLALKGRFISITYDESVLIQCRGKTNTTADRFMVHYFPDFADNVSEGTPADANDAPFCLQVFFPITKILQAQTLEELLILVNQY